MEVLGAEFGNSYASLPSTVFTCEVTQNDALPLYQSVPVNGNGSFSSVGNPEASIEPALECLKPLR